MIFRYSKQKPINYTIPTNLKKFNKRVIVCVSIVTLDFNLDCTEGDDTLLYPIQHFDNKSFYVCSMLNWKERERHQFSLQTENGANCLHLLLKVKFH